MVVWRVSGVDGVLKGWLCGSVYWLHETSVASCPQVSFIASKE